MWNAKINYQWYILQFYYSDHGSEWCGLQRVLDNFFCVSLLLFALTNSSTYWSIRPPFPPATPLPSSPAGCLVHSKPLPLPFSFFFYSFLFLLHHSHFPLNLYIIIHNIYIPSAPFIWKIQSKSINIFKGKGPPKSLVLNVEFKIAAPFFFF